MTWGLTAWGGAFEGDGTAPEVMNLTPAEGELATDRSPIEFDIIDMNSAIRNVDIFIKFANSERPWLIYDGVQEKFWNPCERNSTILPISNGYHVKLVPNGVWLDTSFTITVRAVDVAGTMDA